MGNYGEHFLWSLQGLIARGGYKTIKLQNLRFFVSAVGGDIGREGVMSSLERLREGFLPKSHKCDQEKRVVLQIWIILGWGNNWMPPWK